MVIYQWKGISNKKLIRGKLEAESQEQVKIKLHQKNIIPIRIRRHFQWHKSRITTSNILAFTEQLLLLFSANIPLEKSLTIILQSEKNPPLSEIINCILQDICQGQSLYQSMNKFPQCFNVEYIAFIKAGETTGELNATLNQLVLLLKTQINLKNKLKKALSYPIFLLICTVLMTLGIFIFILPRYQDFFAQMGSQLPLLTQELMRLSNLFIHHGLLIALSFLVLFTILNFALKHPTIRYCFDSCLLKIPVIRELILYSTLARWTALMSVAFKTHIPVLSSIKLANQAITNRCISRQFSMIPKQLSLGGSLFTCLEKTKLFTTTSLQMILIGENTGALTTIFSKIAKRYQALLSDYLAKLIKLAEPTIMLFLAFVTGLIIAALYLPMVNIGLKIN